MRRLKKKGQSTLEYALIIAVVVAGLLAMQHYIKRGYSGRLKSSADDVGEQFDPAAYSGTFNISLDTTANETVQNKTTTKTYSSYTDSKTGSENITAWQANQTLF